MIAEVRAASSSLRTARQRHGFAMRAERRAAVNLLRACLDEALLMIAAEARPLPFMFRTEAEPRTWCNAGRGVLVLDLTKYERTQVGHDETYSQDGWQVWVRPDGTLIEVEQVDQHDRFDEWSRQEYLHGGPRPIGLRKAVRRYSGDDLVRGLLDALTSATKQHEEQTAETTARAERWRTSLSAIMSESA